MNPIVLFSVCLVLTTFSACSGRPSESTSSGKYTVSKNSFNDDGKYRPVKRNEGRYIHMVQPYVHTHDNRELGKYVHIPNPYDGGYGPYSGLNNPYRHDESGNYDKYTVSNAEFQIPAIRLEYGFPDHDPEGVNKKITCELSNPKVHDKPIMPNYDVQKIMTNPKVIVVVTDKPVVNDVEKLNIPMIVSTERSPPPPVLHDDDGVAQLNIPKKMFDDSVSDKKMDGDIETETDKNIETTSTTTRRPTTTTTTTVKPRLFNYYEEGGWKILRQEEEKKKHKYDFLYHTENGIYGEEKAHLHPGNGTAASGYYEYTGDDGELYRVNYKSDHDGFRPEGDHIPTPPPVPDAIKRALEYVAKKKETHGAVQSGRYEHKTDPIRRQNMPTIDRPLLAQPQPQGRSLPALPLPALPTLGALPPLPTLAPIAAQPRFIQYSGQNQYDALPTIAPQNAPQSAYKLPSLISQRPADQLIQQTQLNQESQPDQLPQVQVLLPQIEEQKPVVVEPVAVASPVVVAELSSAPVQEEQPQSDQPQPEEQLQADQPVVDAQQSQPEQSPINEEPQSSDDPLQMSPSEDSIVIVRPDSDEEEVLPEASEQSNHFHQPPFEVAESLIDEENFELTMA